MTPVASENEMRQEDKMGRVPLMCYIAVWKLKVQRLGEVQGPDHHDRGS